MESQRIRVSKTMLKNALLSLLQEKRLDQISVLEICSTAQINRTTFYKYYGCQADLLDEIVNEFFTELDQVLTTKQKQNADGLPFALNYLYEHKATFNVIVKSISSQDFTDRLFSLSSVHHIFQIAFEVDGKTVTQDKYLQKFLSHGLLAIFTEWLGSEIPESVQEITAMLTRYRTVYLSLIKKI